MKVKFVNLPNIGGKDRDGDGYPEIMVKFNRQKVNKVLREGEVTLFAIGEVDGRYFISKDRIRVIDG